MKLLSVVALTSAFFITNVVGVNVQKILEGELAHIQNLTDSLGDAIKAWDGSNYTDALATIYYPAQDLAYYVGNATADLKKTPTSFGLTPAFEIASPVQFLAYSVNASVAELNIRHAAFQKASILPFVVDALQLLDKNADTFADLIISYVPDYLQPVAELLKRQIITSIDLGISCGSGKKSSCVTSIVDPNRTRPLAIKYNAMHRDGSPIA